MSNQFHKAIRSMHLKTPSNTQTNPNPSFQDSKEKLPTSFTKSPYAASFAKSSSSFSKAKIKSTSCITSGITSPQYPSSPANKHPQNSVIKKHLSSILSRKKIFVKASQKKLLINETRLETEIKEEDLHKEEQKTIKKKLNELILNIRQNSLNYENFERIKEVFAEIIEKDSVFGRFLAQVKEVYEEWIRGKLGFVAENSQLKLEVAQLGLKIQEMEQEAILLKETIGKLSYENAKLGKDNDTKDKQYRSLQEHLVKISSIDKSIYPPTEDSWKLLIVENQTYSEICDCMKIDIKNLKTNENKLLDLIDLLRTEGYPVDEIYRKLVYPKFSKKKPKKAKKLEIGSEEEENLITSPRKPSKIPDLIPLLDLNKLPAALHQSSPSKQSSSINSF